MKTSRMLLHKLEIQIWLLIREALMCIYLPLTLTPFKCRWQKCVELQPQTSICPHYMLRDNCTPTFPRLMKEKISFLRVTVMSLKLPLSSFCERSQLDLLSNASCGLCVKQKLQILLRTDHGGACARRRKHVLRFL